MKAHRNLNKKKKIKIQRPPSKGAQVVLLKSTALYCSLSKNEANMISDISVFQEEKEHFSGIKSVKWQLKGK